MSKTRRRYVVELTEAQFEALFSCAVCGMDTFSDDDQWRRMINKCDEAIINLNNAKQNGLKTIK